MAYMIKVQTTIDGLLETKNHFIETLEEAMAFVDKHPYSHCRVFNESGEHKHERHPVGIVTIDVPSSLFAVVS